ncbi:MAG: glucuronate isomerase [Bacteroidota bacterium]
MKEFISDDFLLSNKTAVKLYHDYASAQPIIDYHCHLSPQEIAEDKRWENMTQIWLYGDHYKWRAMRTNGVDERFITGKSTDWEKFYEWSKTVPKTLRNPLYHWTHMELKQPFGITDVVLNEKSAKSVWERTNALLNSDGFSCRGIMKKANVELVVTTDDPTDNLEYHRKIKADENFNVQILPAFRPDKGMAVENPAAFQLWVEKLGVSAGMTIANYSDYLDAIKKRHTYFHERGCRVSDHGIETAYAEEYTDAGINAIFTRIMSGKSLTTEEILKFKSAMLYEFGVLDHSRGWVQQYHLGALRNPNTRMFTALGPDTGYDVIGDFEIARPLTKLLDRLDKENKLAKTIVYNLNPRDNELMASIIGAFQDGSAAGKIQYGSAWWFLDQQDGIERQLSALSNMGLLSRFVGMLTDSRSFLSYPRHDYFRRIVCSLFGADIENGLLPNDLELIGNTITDISYRNAKNYFGFTIGEKTTTGVPV